LRFGLVQFPGTHVRVLRQAYGDRNKAQHEREHNSLCSHVSSCWEAIGLFERGHSSAQAEIDQIDGRTWEATIELRRCTGGGGRLSLFYASWNGFPLLACRLSWRPSNPWNPLLLSTTLWPSHRRPRMWMTT